MQYAHVAMQTFNKPPNPLASTYFGCIQVSLLWAIYRWGMELVAGMWN